jgi:hypothetical protein
MYSGRIDAESALDFLTIQHPGKTSSAFMVATSSLSAFPLTWLKRVFRPIYPNEQKGGLVVSVNVSWKTDVCKLRHLAG